ncbi:transcriptional regulator, partial [Acinetobacter baumannii]
APEQQAIGNLVNQLKEWAETNIEQVLAAQMTYDEKVLEQA